jgi:MoxR-like ATPase
LSHETDTTEETPIDIVPEDTAREPPNGAARDVDAVAELRRARDEIVAEVQKRIVGQTPVIDLLLTALFARGHCLFVGVPGLAKTLLISTLAEVLDLRFNRVQFTPDLMPSDITGTDVLEEDQSTGRRAFRFIHGPIFANLVLADEINRTPPKTQAALLQAMQESRVTAGGRTHALEAPFLVFATQNPIEQEGTYPLPEAQLDRFMFEVDVGYPSEAEELLIAQQTSSGHRPSLRRVLSPARILALQDLILRVPVADHVTRYAVALVRATRPLGKGQRPGVDRAAPRFIEEHVAFGAGPRASQYLLLGAKARAALDGRPSPTVEDVRALARPVLQHRLITSFQAEAEGVRAADLIDQLVRAIRPE